MGVRFVWDDNYSVGNPEIDQQHKKLFELGNGIPDLVNTVDIKQTIMDLYRYTREHFTNEEAMMRRIGFPLYAEHKILHEDLITQLNEVSSGPFDTDESVLKFKMFFYDWLTEHVLTQDRKYFEFSHQPR